MIRKSVTVALTTLMLMSIVHAESKYGTVNGDELTQLDIDMTMGPSGMEFSTLNDAMKKRVLDMAVERKLLAQEAEKSDVKSSAAYKEQLSGLEKGLVLDLWMKQKMKKVENDLSNGKLEKYYKDNTKKYETPKQLKARHILVKAEDEAKAIIKEITDAEDKKEKFIELAKSKSTGPSGPNGGDLGWFPLDQMVKPFSDAADKLKKDEFTKSPVKTQFGFHIIYLDDRKEAGARKFDEVKSEIKDELIDKEFAENIQKMVANLKKTAKIELKKLEETEVKVETKK